MIDAHINYWKKTFGLLTLTLSLLASLDTFGQFGNVDYETTCDKVTIWIKQDIATGSQFRTSYIILFRHNSPSSYIGDKVSYPVGTANRLYGKYYVVAWGLGSMTANPTSTDFHTDKAGDYTATTSWDNRPGKSGLWLKLEDLKPSAAEPYYTVVLCDSDEGRLWTRDINFNGLKANFTGRPSFRNDGVRHDIYGGNWEKSFLNYGQLDLKGERKLRPPTNITVKETCDGVDISWGKSPDFKQFKEYIVYRGNREIAKIPNNQNSFRDKREKYVYDLDKEDGFLEVEYKVVMAYPSRCENSPAKSKKISIIPAPNHPTDIAAEPVNGDCSKMQLSWSDNTQYGGGYKVFVDGVERKKLSKGADQFVLDGLTQGNTYNLRVDVLDRCDRNFNNPVTKALKISSLPPKITSVQSRTTNAKGITLRWDIPPTNAVNAFKKIKVIRDEAVIKELTASDTSFNDTELSDCQKVKYKIASSNLCGDTESDPRETSIKPFIRDPRITASEGTSPSNVSLNWIDVDFEKGYDLFRNGDLIFKAAADLNFYKDEDAVPGEIYEYCVKGYSSCTESVLSCAHGYRNPNGTVTGNVKTEFGGFAVEGVEMKVTPVQDNSKKFDGNSHIDIKIDQWPK